ncbi:Tll0287-like domain-containing protein [Alteromonas lipolytica]|uniref:Tll0287-like domain-containing protein n=1 Tax=Alteromonas lipolytica TaxID=1856405 RepID=A0A1E8FCA5_9ALTE|nr:DUF3365 domain-containing protein [Alteromonas lipolytica]OFI33133.1 hypothetical protein BFC17_02415 [Alteromonas lipolytica]GGF62182.1 hypothetical protein GCM10011338_13230 [Alteromonas lipolytica]
MTKLSKVWIAVACLLPALTTVAGQLTQAEFTSQAKQKAMQLGKTLKMNLQAAVKEGGLTNGVNVCKDIAPAVAAELSTDGWQVGRTALKVRNPSNQPDSWEQTSLMTMVKGLEEGLKPGSLTQVSMDDEAGQYRFMAPIMTDSLCLNCHGAELAPAVQAEINQQYPHDQATGFAAGDLRGAFTVTYNSEE